MPEYQPNSAIKYIPGLGKYFKISKDDVEFVVLTQEQYGALETAYLLVNKSNRTLQPAIEDLDNAHTAMTEGIYLLNKANEELAKRLDLTAKK